MIIHTSAIIATFAMNQKQCPARKQLNFAAATRLVSHG
jgi:hypothetical protein